MGKPECIEPGSGRLAAEWAATLEPRLQDALDHPVRREVLRRLNECGEGGTARQIVPDLRPIDIRQVSYHLHVLIRDEIVVRDRSAVPGEHPAYISTVVEEPQVLKVLRATEEWDRQQRDVAARGVASLRKGQIDE
ncbi:MAG TPA: helix-turn-helix domain-containing protein [Solirubrobacterales bacterium]|nr:helix-turn-helix domain-containing protein [Solirubrobacterales bacterium]